MSSAGVVSGVDNDLYDVSKTVDSNELNSSDWKIALDLSSGHLRRAVALTQRGEQGLFEGREDLPVGSERLDIAVGDAALVSTVHDVAVLPELQRLGLGRSLLVR